MQNSIKVNDLKALLTAQDTRAMSAAQAPRLTPPVPAPSFRSEPGTATMDVVRYSEADLPTVYGPFRLYVYREAQTSGQPSPGSTSLEHMAIVRGDLRGQEAVLCRIHSECWTSEVIGSMKCDCREQLEAALKRVAAEGSGVVVYLRQEGRGIGLGNKIKAYALQNEGADTVEANIALGFEADSRNYDLAGAILNDLGVKSVRLMTNNPLKMDGLRQAGVEVVGRQAHWVAENRYNAQYLAVKRRKMGHHADNSPRLLALPGAKKP
ncbi:MAG: GTP cyclohydrolase II [Deltaproteobacteria bacterium]|nr:GTP cyclohydrolase II [Deltaproteobacteria bacterium]